MTEPSQGYRKLFRDDKASASAHCLQNAELQEVTEEEAAGPDGIQRSRHAGGGLSKAGAETRVKLTPFGSFNVGD